MHNNITESDAESMVKFLSKRPLPILTNGEKVREFEREWSKWLGVKYSIFVNSGSSANIITLAYLASIVGTTRTQVIVSPLNWVSDITAILHARLQPVFCDINPKTLALDDNKLAECITDKTGAILLTHILGYNGLTPTILELVSKHRLHLVEDVCESHGATYNGHKVGTFGDISNFSFYYAHHMTSIEGGMICTNNELAYEQIRTYRSHGMLREMDNKSLKKHHIDNYPDLNPDFIFLNAAYNMRSTEINAVLALNQLPRLNANNKERRNNLETFLNNLDPKRYFTEFNRDGNSNYAFTLALIEKNIPLRDRVEKTLRENGVEFRRGMSGGGNQLRQPYLTHIFGNDYAIQFPICDHIHFFGWYIGNYPSLETSSIIELTKILNEL
jgi:CDP-6-deoxy-D-xylo-4-hexulose-3-dehydrase